MIKNKKIIAALCAATVVVIGISIPAAADTTGSGYTYGQSSEGTVTTQDGKEVNVSIGNTYGATEKQKDIYENFANYLDGLKNVDPGIINAIKADAAEIIINGGNPVDGDYKIDDPNVKADAQLIIINNKIKEYDPNATYVSSKSTANKIEEVLVNNSAGGGMVSKQEVTSTVIQGLEVKSTDQNAALLGALFLDQSVESVQAAINSGTLNADSANILDQVAGANSSINGVIMGNETLNEFCQTRNLSYQDAINYIIALGTMPEDQIPKRDKNLASAVNNLFNVSDGNAHEAIVKNMVAVMNESNKELAAAQAYLRQLVVTEVYEKDTIIVVNENAGTGYTELYNELMSLNTIGEGTKYIEGIAYSYKTYFNEEAYDGQKLINSLKIMFPGYEFSAEYESFLRDPPQPYPEDFDEQLVNILNQIQQDYDGDGKNKNTSIPLYGGCKPESFLITTKNASGATSEITTVVAASKEIHRTVDTMVFELQRFDGLSIMESERAYTDAEIFASLYNMYFTPEVRAKDPNSESMFTILDLYMQLHAQTYGKVGMPPITTEYKNDMVIYTIDFKTGIQSMAQAVGISYEDFVRNYFSSYTRPSYYEWVLDPSMHTYSFYPQETSTNYIPKLTQMNETTGQMEPYYLGTVHSTSEIRGDSLLTAKIFPGSFGNMIRAIGNVGGRYNDKQLKTDSVRPLLLTLRPEISSIFNVHVYTTGTILEDGSAIRAANTDTASEGKSWYFYPYREVFMSEGGSYAGCGASVSEKWGPASYYGDIVSNNQENKIFKAGCESLLQNIVNYNNSQFAHGRGDMASYYNYIVYDNQSRDRYSYNEQHSSNMPTAYSYNIPEWINGNYTGLSEEEENIRFEIYHSQDETATLKVPKDTNGTPIYNVRYGLTRCAYLGGGGGGGSNTEERMNTMNEFADAFGASTLSDATNLFASYGINLPAPNNNGQIEITLNNGTSISTSSANTLLIEVISNGGDLSNFSNYMSDSAATGENAGDIAGPPKFEHPNDGCIYCEECCTSWFTATWNSTATIPYIVMDDVSPTGYDDSTLISQPYEMERIFDYPKNNRPDSVFHWRWSQTLEGDPNGDETTSFITTTETIPVYIPNTPSNPFGQTDPNSDEDTNNPTNPNPDRNTNNTTGPNPDKDSEETTYRTTGSDLPPFPTPITIPSDEPNEGKVVIEQFISK